METFIFLIEETFEVKTAGKTLDEYALNVRPLITTYFCWSWNSPSHLNNSQI